MAVKIQAINTDTIHQAGNFNRKFIVDSKLVIGMENGNLTYSVISVPPYEKEIPVDEVNPCEFINNDEKIIFFACVGDVPVGQVTILTWWNKFAYIEDLIINPEFRGQGVGHALMGRAVEWAKEKRFPGVMLETQDDNVAACKLYEACGFILGGVDKYTFTNIKPNETALFWYLIF